MYGAEDPSIAAMVLDSPFSDLVDLMMELVDTYKFPLPKFTVSKSIFVASVYLLQEVLFNALSIADKICITIYAESCSEESQV